MRPCRIHVFYARRDEEDRTLGQRRVIHIYIYIMYRYLQLCVDRQWRSFVYFVFSMFLFFFLFFILFPDDVRPPRITQTENYTVWKAIPSQMLYPSNLDLCRRLFPFWMTHANSIDYRRAAARNVSLMARRYINCPLHYLSCIAQYNTLCYYLHKLCRVNYNNRHEDENDEIDTLCRYIHIICHIINSRLVSS